MGSKATSVKENEYVYGLRPGDRRRQDNKPFSGSIEPRLLPGIALSVAGASYEV